MNNTRRILLWLPYLAAATLAACGGGSETVGAGDASSSQLMAGGLAVRDAYALGLQAMQDVNKKTDVYITLQPNDSSVAPAGSIKQVQLKSFDLAGVLRWTKNESDVPAPAGAGGASTADLSYTDMARYQPVQAQVLAQTAQTVKTQVLRATAPVKYRPDLTIGAIQAPQQVRVGQVLNVVATVKELNGDLGATTRVSLKQGATELDDATGVQVNSGGATQVVLSTKFDRVGEYTLTVSALDVQPGDYDASNNSKSFTVQVVPDVQSVNYALAFSGWSGSSRSQWNDWYGSGETSLQGEYQWLGESLWTNEIGKQLAFPITKVAAQIAVDGGQTPLTRQFAILQTASWSWDCYSNSAGWAYQDGISVYVQVVNACGTPATYVSLYDYAGDYIYYSRYHSYYWGDAVSGPTAVKYGTLLHPTRSVETSLLVTGANGITIGGRAQTAVTQQPIQDSGTWSWGSYFNSWWNNYVVTSGWSSGVTQP